MIFNVVMTVSTEYSIDAENEDEAYEIAMDSPLIDFSVDDLEITPEYEDDE